MTDKPAIGNTQFAEDCESPQGNSAFHLQTEAGSSVIHTCDICPKVIFESEKALERHIEIRHKSLMEGINVLLAKQRADFTVDLSDGKLAALGTKAFDVAKKRDAGHGMLECASTARQQLQHIVDVWHPGAEVFIFGSSLVMSSWDGKSDIDFAVVDPQAYIQRKWPPEEKTAVRELTELCKSAGFKVSSLECVDTARVPIVKHKTLQDSLLNTAENAKRAEKARRSIRLTYRSEKIPNTEALRPWLEKETETGTIEDVLDEGQSTATVTFTTSTKAMVAMININNGQKRRLNEFFSARILDERFPPEAHCIDFDLCLRHFGIRNSEYLRKLHTLYDNSPFLRSGAVVLKEWSKLWGLNNSFMGFLTSYAINIMWIYFLVKRDVIPYISPNDTPEDPREALREPTYVPLLPANATSSDVQMKMGSLLADFFTFYAIEFDWEKNVVSLNRPGITTKKSIGWTSENEIKLSRQSKNVQYVVCIEDPYEPNLNLGRHLGVCKARKIKAEFRRAALSVINDKVDECIMFTSKYKKQLSVPIKEPPREIFEKVQKVVYDSFGTTGAQFTPDSLRQMLIESCPTAFQTLSIYWNWKFLVRRLGLRQIGDQIHKRTCFDFLSEKQRGKPAFKVPVQRPPVKNVVKDTLDDCAVASVCSPNIVKTSFTHFSPLSSHSYRFQEPRSRSLGSIRNLFRCTRI